MFIFSCSKSDIKDPTGSRELSKHEKMILKNPEIETELIMLMEFNESLLKERGAKTRGWFGRLASTVNADALAAYGGFKASVGAAAFITAATGGTAGPAAGVAVLSSTAFIAGGASYGAHQALKSRAASDNLPAFTMKSADIQNILNSNNISNQPDINSLIYHSDSYNYIGYLHNQYLEMLLTDWSKTRSSNNETDLSENSFFSKEQLDEMYNRVMIHINEYLSSGYDYDKCIAKFSENDLSTKKNRRCF